MIKVGIYVHTFPSKHALPLKSKGIERGMNTNPCLLANQVARRIFTNTFGRSNPLKDMYSYC